MRQSNRLRHICFCAVVSVALAAQTKVDLGTQSRNIDFSGATFTKPFKSGTVVPPSCAVGETYFKTNATAGQNLYGCVAADTWVVLSGASAGLPPVAGQSGKILSNNGVATDWRFFGGDVSGSPDALAVGRLQGRAVSGAAPGNGQALVWNASTSLWEPATVIGVGPITGAQLAAADYTPSRTGNTVLTLPSVPAFTFQVGTAACANAVGGATITTSNGTGTLWVALGGDCTIKVRHNVVASCVTGCTAIGGASGFDPSDLPLYEWTVSAGALAASGTRRLTPYGSMPLVAGANVTLTSSAGVTTISAAGGGLSSGGGIAAGSSLPAACVAGEYFSHSTTRSLWRCYQNNLAVLVNWEPKDFIVSEDFTAANGDPSIIADARAPWYKDAGGIPVHTAGGTLPNFGTVAITTASGAGAKASLAWSGLGAPSGAPVQTLAANFYMEITWKTSRATDIKLFAGFQDGATNLLQYGERIGLRYEAAASPGVYKLTAANTAIAYGALPTLSTITAGAGFHTLRAWRLDSANYFMSVDGETPVSFAGETPSNNGTLYVGVQTDSASPVTLTLDRVFLWAGVAR